MEHEGKRRGLNRFSLQTSHIVRNVEPDDDDGTNVENDDPPENSVDSSRNVSNRVSLFSSRDSNRFSSSVSESRRNEKGSESAETVDERRFSDGPVTSTDF